MFDLSDARDRLAHLGRISEQAATQVLNLVDAAQPACQAACSDALAVAARLQAAADHPALGVGEARAALAEAADALRQQAAANQAQLAVLSDILLAQGFHDQSGQMIRKLLASIGHAELQALQWLVPRQAWLPALAWAPPAGGRPARPMRLDSVLAQDEVDELLAALGC